jgi:dTDP-4-dehydrorhamnose reductase
MKILITGGNGLLGQKLAANLEAKPENQVILTGRRANAGMKLPAHFIFEECDITEGEAFLKLVVKHHPDAIIHGAAMTNVDECELNPVECQAINVEGTRNVVLACNAVGAHLVHVSTDFIFDGEDGPYLEDAKPHPISVYGQSKLDAEEIVQKECKGLWAIARTVLVYGIAPGLSRSNIILWVKSSLEQGKKIQVVDDQFRTPTLAEDLALGCLLMVEKKASGIFNISGKDFLTPYQMANMTADFFKLDKSLITKASSATFTQPAKRPPRTGFIISKAENELGYSPFSFQEGMELLAKQMAESEK